MVGESAAIFERRFVKLDPIRLVEACYAPAQDERVWARGMLEALAPADAGFGVVAAGIDLRGTVAGYLHSSQAKLGVGSRRALIEMFGGGMVARSGAAR